MAARLDAQSKKVLGEIFKEMREKVKLTQAEVAQLLELKSSQYISNVERGDSFFSVVQLTKLSKFYRVTQAKMTRIVLAEVKESFRREWEKYGLNPKKQNLDELRQNFAKSTTVPSSKKIIDSDGSNNPIDSQVTTDKDNPNTPENKVLLSNSQPFMTSLSCYSSTS